MADSFPSTSSSSSLTVRLQHGATGVMNGITLRKPSRRLNHFRRTLHSFLSDIRSVQLHLKSIMLLLMSLMLRWVEIVYRLFRMMTRRIPNIIHNLINPVRGIIKRWSLFTFLHNWHQSKQFILLNTKRDIKADV